MAEEGERVFRVGGVSYLRIPAADPAQAAAFYEAVFGWLTDVDEKHARFADASGHVIGHFVSDIATAGEAGVRPYIYVESVVDALRRAGEHGGSTVTPPYPEGNLRVATLRDQAGNVIGVWQRAEPAS